MFAYNSISAQAAFFPVNGMVPYFERVDYESAAGKYKIHPENMQPEKPREIIPKYEA